MLAVANRLFVEFDDLPMMTVIRSLTAARAELGDERSRCCEAVEDRARQHLRHCRQEHRAITSSTTVGLGAIVAALAFAANVASLAASA